MTETNLVVEANISITDMLRGELYETTEKDKAVKAGFNVDGHQFKPKKIITGQGEIIKGIEEELTKMKEKERKIIHLEPKDGFGERNPELTRVVALKDFRDRKLNPVPGLLIEVNNLIGKVQSVSGGRVRVDFNHPLAGKKIEVELELVREIKDNKEKLEVLGEKYFPFIKKENIEVKDSELIITAKGQEKQAVKIMKERFDKMSETLFKGTKIKLSLKDDKEEPNKENEPAENEN